MKMLRLLMVGVFVGVALISFAGQALAGPTTINWWHSMKGARGEVAATMIRHLMIHSLTMWLSVLTKAIMTKRSMPVLPRIVPKNSRISYRPLKLAPER